MRAKALLGEALDQKTDLLNARPLDDRETSWLSGLISSALKVSIIRIPTHADWEIRMEEEDFLNWRLSLQVHCLFFDGASKGNPGPSGGGVVILMPSGSIQSSFAWGLGVETNNFVEFYALWQGLRQALSLKIRNISVFGDSRLVIQAM